MKKLLTTLALLFGMITVVNAQKFEYVYQGMEFKCKFIDRKTSVCITGFTRDERNVTIPAKVAYRGYVYPVKTIDTYNTIDFYSTETLTIEEGVKDIDKNAFQMFRKLREVTLPSTITHVGKKAFRDKDLTFHQPGNIDEASLLQGREWWAIKSSTIANNPMAQAPVTNQNSVGSVSPQRINGNASTSVQPSSLDENRLADVDINIPINRSGSNADTYCVIMANEKYSEAADVAYAAHDGEVFKEYCVKTLGIPEKQVKTYINATYTDVKKAFNNIKTFASVMDGKAKIIFYYAGHGIPNERDKAAYLLPVDGSPTDLTTCYKLGDLYAQLGNSNIQQCTVLLDACFSGVGRGSGDALVEARSVAISPREEKLNGNIVVFAATTANETAMAYQEKRHGMFTYYLLSELKKSHGQTSFGELFHAVTSDVKKNSFVENDKLQTPSVYSSVSMRGKWQDLRF